MRITIILLVVAVMLLAGCASQTQSWAQSASASCSGLICINSGNVAQNMPQPSADKILLAAALLAVGSVLLVALGLGGAL
jgi:hypothetical protein